MKIKFDSNQAYQREAIDAVLWLFDGQPLRSGAFEFDMAAGTLSGLSELGLGNRLELDGAGIHVAEYLTVLPPPEVLHKKLHDAITTARAD